MRKRTTSPNQLPLRFEQSEFGALDSATQKGSVVHVVFRRERVSGHPHLASRTGDESSSHSSMLSRVLDRASKLKW